MSTAIPQAHFDLNTIGQAVQGINLGQLRQTPVLLPERDEQDRIVDVIGTEFRRITSERAYRHKLQRLKNGLMQDLLTGCVRVPDTDELVSEVVA